MSYGVCGLSLLQTTNSNLTEQEDALSIFWLKNLKLGRCYGDRAPFRYEQNLIHCKRVAATTSLGGIGVVKAKTTAHQVFRIVKS